MPSKRLLIASLWTVLIFGICWTPRQMMTSENPASMPFDLPYIDKVVHAAMFFGFGFCWMWTGVISLRWVLVLGVGAAVLSELGQMAPVVNRDAEWSDGVADTVGVGMGLLGYLAWRRLLKSSGRFRVEPNQP